MLNKSFTKMAFTFFVSYRFILTTGIVLDRVDMYFLKLEFLYLSDFVLKISPISHL